MKKVLYTIVASLFVFNSCEKNLKYTNEQKNALETLKGNYHAYVDREMIFSVVSFTANYLTPHEVSDENKLLFYAHGECYFSDYQYPIPDQGYITCYYFYSEKADSIAFYYKDGINMKKLLRTYTLNILNCDTFMLIDNGRVLTFERAI